MKSKILLISIFLSGFMSGWLVTDNFNCKPAISATTISTSQPAKLQPLYSDTGVSVTNHAPQEVEARATIKRRTVKGEVSAALGSKGRETDSVTLPQTAAFQEPFEATSDTLSFDDGCRSLFTYFSPDILHPDGRFKAKHFGRPDSVKTITNVLKEIQYIQTPAPDNTWTNIAAYTTCGLAGGLLGWIIGNQMANP